MRWPAELKAVTMLRVSGGDMVLLARDNRVLRWLPRDVTTDDYQHTSFPALSAIPDQIGTRTIAAHASSLGSPYHILVSYHS